MNKYFKIFITLFIIAAITYTSVSAYQSMPHEEEAKHWSYTGTEGPQHWDEAKGHETCATGHAQTPINIDTKDAVEGTTTYEFSYVEKTFIGENNGHSVEYKLEEPNENNSLKLNGTTYKLLQFHFHSPSENTVNQLSAPMEMHLVHKSSEGELAVVSLFLFGNDTNPTFNNLWDFENKSSLELQYDFSKLILGSGYYFKGSLTTPPCTEDVNWLVLDQKAYVPFQDIQSYYTIFGSPTNRPLQDVNGRKIERIK